MFLCQIKLYGLWSLRLGFEKRPPEFQSVPYAAKKSLFYKNATCIMFEWRYHQNIFSLEQNFLLCPFSGKDTLCNWLLKQFRATSTKSRNESGIMNRLREKCLIEDVFPTFCQKKTLTMLQNWIWKIIAVKCHMLWYISVLRKNSGSCYGIFEKNWMKDKIGSKYSVLRQKTSARASRKRHCHLREKWKMKIWKKKKVTEISHQKIDNHASAASKQTSILVLNAALSPFID